MDITPIIPEGRKIITGYGASGFMISGENYNGSIVVLPHKVFLWPEAAIDAASIENLSDLLQSEAAVEILLLGVGEKHTPVSPSIRHHFKQQGIALESMTTGAACRTYNVLLSEGRKVGAALISVG